LQGLSGELKTLEKRLANLYEAVELGVLPIDSTLQDRAQKLKSERETVLIQMAGLKRRKTMPLDNVNPAKIDAFANALQTRLRDSTSNFGKDYLRLLIDEIRVEGETATVRGSYGALADAVAEIKMDTTKVPIFITNWCGRRDSNSLPLGS
jgi:site-specific DNA recombinase